MTPGFSGQHAPDSTPSATAVECVSPSSTGYANGVHHKLLPIYLNDHLAGATAGRDLARRAAGSNRSDEGYHPALTELAREIQEDRDSLRLLMRRLDIGTDRAKQLAAWAAEKAGRLKLNGRLLRYSPLSRLEELEALALGVTGKLALWRTLRLLARQEPRLSAQDLERLVERAEQQLKAIETCHRRAAIDAFLLDAQRRH